MSTISLALGLLALSPDGEDTAAVRCPACRRPLTLHQPDPGWPDRLVGTCEGCRTWLLIDAAMGVMVRLPGEEELRGAESRLR